MTLAQVQPLNIPTASELTGSGAPKGSLWAGLLQVLGNRYERKSAATVGLVFFVASLTLAPALTRDQKKLASEINAKTLKAAATIKSTTRLPLRVQNSQENEQRRGAEDTRPKFSRLAKLRFS